MAHIEIMVDATGEVIELAASTAEEIAESWQIVDSYIKAYEKAKDRLKKVLPEFQDNKGIVSVSNGIFRIIVAQRTNYDKFYLRQVFDEDTLDLFLEPAKTKIDKHIAEHLDELKEGSTLLRTHMVAVGRPYQTIRFEKQ